MSPLLLLLFVLPAFADRHFLDREAHLERVAEKLKMDANAQSGSTGLEMVAKRVAETVSNEAASSFNLFLDSLNDAIGTRNPIAISSHFDSKFEFRGCKGTTLNREQFVKEITAVPSKMRILYHLEFTGPLEGNELLHTGVRVNMADTQKNHVAAKQFTFSVRTKTIQAGKEANCS